MDTYNLKAGQALTIVTDASTTGRYSLIGDANNDASGNTSFNASSTTIIGPFSNDRRYRVDTIAGLGVTVSQAYSTDAADVALLAPKASPTFTGTVTLPTAWKVGSTTITPTAAQLNFVAGVTSALQTQMDGKAPKSNVAFQADLAVDADGTAIAAFVNGLKAALVAAGIMAAS